jgi:hypothetical protein
MLDLLPAPDHVSAMRLSGWLTADDYDRVSREVEHKLAMYERIGLYVDASELRGITPGGLVKDLRYAFDKLGEYRRFARGAVVTQRPLLRTVTRVAGAALPVIELRAFGSAEEDAAMEWAASAPVELRRPALRLIPTTRSDTVAFAWNGTIAAKDAAEIVTALELAIERHGKIRLLGRMERLGGIAAGAFTQTRLLALKRHARRRVERYAIVGGPRWLERWVAAVRALWKVELQHFDAADERAAWAWLEAQPAAETTAEISGAAS